MYEILRLLECLESSIIAILKRYNQFSAVQEWLRDGCGAGKGLAIGPLFSGLSTPMFAGRPYLAVDFFSRQHCWRRQATCLPVGDEVVVRYSSVGLSYFLKIT